MPWETVFNALFGRIEDGPCSSQSKDYSLVTECIQPFDKEYQSKLVR